MLKHGRNGMSSGNWCLRRKLRRNLCQQLSEGRSVPSTFGRRRAVGIGDLLRLVQVSHQAPSSDPIELFVSVFIKNVYTKPSVTKCHSFPLKIEAKPIRNDSRGEPNKRLTRNSEIGPFERKGQLLINVSAKRIRCFAHYFLTTTSSSPDSSFTRAVPHVVGFPVLSNQHPKSPAFFSLHCPALTATTNHPDPTGRPAEFP